MRAPSRINPVSGPKVSAERAGLVLDAMIEEVGNPQSGDLGQLRLGDMPMRFREVISLLSVEQPSGPVRTDTGIHVFIVCTRIEPEPDIPTRDEIGQSIFAQQVEMLARRLIRDLRRDALIDVR